jgi:hypothetical protein
MCLSVARIPHFPHLRRGEALSSWQIMGISKPPFAANFGREVTVTDTLIQQVFATQIKRASDLQASLG